MTRRPAGELAHGTIGGYNGGCRCDRCRDAWNRYMRGYRARGHRAGWFRGPGRRLSVTVTPLGLRRARAFAAAQRRRVDDVVEAALRAYDGDGGGQDGQSATE